MCKSAVHVFGANFLAISSSVQETLSLTHIVLALPYERSVGEGLQFVLSYPNGALKRQDCRLVSIRFMTEGVASLHAYVLNGLANAILTMHCN